MLYGPTRSSGRFFSFDSFRFNMEKGPVPVFRSQAPLYGKLHYTTTKQKQKPFISLSFSLSLSPSGLVVMLNPGFAQITHVTSAGFVSSSPGIALKAPRVGSKVKAGFHPGHRFARTQVESRRCLFLVVDPLRGS
jgi:hypothetical protein